MGRNKIQKRNPELTRKAILDAAKALFISKGCDGVSISEIADKAGITKSLIHHYFSSKDELYREFLKNHFQDYSGKLAEYMAVCTNSTDIVESGFRAYFLFLSDTCEYVRMGLWVNLFYGSDIDRLKIAAEFRNDAVLDPQTRFVHALGAVFLDGIRQAQANGSIRCDIPAEDILASAWCLAEHWHESRALMSLRMQSDLMDSVAEDRFMNSALALLKRGLKPE